MRLKQRVIAPKNIKNIILEVKQEKKVKKYLLIMKLLQTITIYPID